MLLSRRVKSRTHRITGWISLNCNDYPGFIYLSSVFEWALIKQEVSDILKQAGGHAALPVVLALVLAALGGQTTESIVDERVYVG